MVAPVHPALAHAERADAVRVSLTGAVAVRAKAATAGRQRGGSTLPIALADRAQLADTPVAGAPARSAKCIAAFDNGGAARVDGCLPRSDHGEKQNEHNHQQEGGNLPPCHAARRSPSHIIGGRWGWWCRPRSRTEGVWMATKQTPHGPGGSGRGSTLRAIDEFRLTHTPRIRRSTLAVLPNSRLTQQKAPRQRGGALSERDGVSGGPVGVYLPPVPAESAAAGPSLPGSRGLFHGVLRDAREIHDIPSPPQGLLGATVRRP